MGFVVDIFKSPQKVQGYYTSKKNKKAHVILKKKSNKIYADIGFEKVDDKYVIHMDSMDSRKLNKKKLIQLYAKSRLKFEIKRKNAKYALRSETVDKDGRIRIKIGVRGV